ncbi:hypothetical protein ATANTOWER_011745 [Ataeniobius toweri]|uniref:Uncharacterized protein n=1 Tax=Ataeniobius toweri TaxID=208326 RepID=A0ABU7CDR0_9TELE|nr:hypothetical protein [Ataeniobius toweri]
MAKMIRGKTAASGETWAVSTFYLCKGEVVKDMTEGDIGTFGGCLEEQKSQQIQETSIMPSYTFISILTMRHSICDVRFRIIHEVNLRAALKPSHSCYTLYVPFYVGIFRVLISGINVSRVIMQHVRLNPKHSFSVHTNKSK